MRELSQGGGTTGNIPELSPCHITSQPTTIFESHYVKCGVTVTPLHINTIMTSRDLVGSDVSDSVYKEAVTKLKILLSATEHPTMRIGDLKQSGQDKSKSLDQLFTGERGWSLLDA